MQNFADILAIATERKGGLDAVEALLEKPKNILKITEIPNDRWLSSSAKCIFQAGFSWKVVDAKWAGFEKAFYGFDIHRCTMLSDEEISSLESDKRIIRNGQKINAVLQNALFLSDIVSKHGSVSAFILSWENTQYAELLGYLKAHGARLGGMTGQRFLRVMGVDSFVLTKDVVNRLAAEGVISGLPTSKTALLKTQTAFNTWQEQSGRSFTEISRILALSVG